MRIAEAIRAAAARLESVSDTARLDAEVLMAHALGASRSDLLLRHMADPVPEAFAALVARRLEYEPVAYILGSQEFYGRSFAVSPAVLIPRSDSESVVEAALAACSVPVRVLDCGVGSGALLLTLLGECPAASGVGIDCSPEALEIARANAVSLGLKDRAEMLVRDWTKAGWAERLGRFDLILANPPYVEEGAALSPSVREHEPPGALFAGAEGLDDYRILLPQFPALLGVGGVAVVEIGIGQADAVGQIAEQAGFSAELRYDLGGRARAMILRLGLGKPVLNH